MIILGILSVFQVVFLPGYLILRAAHYQTNPFKYLGYCFGLSLIANFLIVWLLTIVHGFIPFVCFVLLFAELLLLFYFIQPWMKISFSDWARKIGSDFNRWFNKISDWMLEIPYIEDQQRLSRLIQMILVIIISGFALSALDWIFRVFITNIGTVFNSWDALFSWNRWAIEWSQNRLPTGAAHYPQLLPTNWAMIYTLTGTTQIQLFAKLIMSLFTFFILLQIAGSAFEYRSTGLLLGVVFAQALLKKFMGDHVAEGYADIPAAFFALSAVICLTGVYRAEKIKEIEMNAWLGAILAAGSASVKQAGLFVLFTYPLMLWLILRRKRQSLPSVRFDIVWKSFLLALLIAMPWYAFKQLAIMSGVEESEVAHITTSVHRFENPIDRLIPAFLSLDIYLVLFLLLIPLLFAMEYPTRLACLLVVIPFTIVWGLFFSYEVRNLALVFPIVGLAAGEGLVNAFQKLSDRFFVPRLARWRMALLIFLIMVVLVFLPFFITNNQIYQKQDEMQKQIFTPGINRQLYETLPEEKSGVHILTNYPVSFLPGLENTQVQFFFNDFNTYASQINQDGINYILIPAYADENILADVMQNVQDGKYQLLFENPDSGRYYFVKIK